MRIIAHHPDISKNTKTLLAQQAVSGQADLVVKNATGFSANDFVVIGNPKQELTEIKKISSISSKTITLTANLVNTHSKSTKITIIRYDQVKFYKATSISGTYSLVSTDDIAIGEDHTEYEDASALSTDYYKFKYYNSHSTNLSVFSDPISQSGLARFSLKKIQDTIFRRTGDTKEKYYTRDEITDWVNEIKDDMVNRIIDCNEKYFNTFENLSVDSDGEADLGDNFRKFQKILVLFDGTNGYRARKIELEDINDFEQNFAQTAPVYYFKQYSMGVRPKGTVGTTLIQVHFEDQPSDLSNDTDLIPKPLRFYMGVIMDGLMARAMERSSKNSVSDRYWKKYEDGIDRMIGEINNLVLDENREVIENNYPDPDEFIL